MAMMASFLIAAAAWPKVLRFLLHKWYTDYVIHKSTEVSAMTDNAFL